MCLPPILVSQEGWPLTLGQPLRSASSTCGILLVFYLNGFFKGYEYSWFLKVRNVLLLFIAFCLLATVWKWKLRRNSSSSFSEGASFAETGSASNSTLSQGWLNSDLPVSASQVIKYHLATSLLSFSLCGSNYPVTHCIDQVTSASQVLGVWAWACLVLSHMGCFEKAGWPGGGGAHL